jgi:hypothetical protein
MSLDESERFELGALLGPPPAARSTLTAQRLRALERALGGAGRPRWRLLAALALGAGAIGAVWLARARESEPPYHASASLRVEEPERGRAFSAGPQDEGTLRFTDGSSVTLLPGARAMVLARDAERAKVAVTDGRVRFDVRQGSGTEWHVSAGPFRVSVAGSLCTVTWWAQRGVLELAVARGSARVEGAGAGAGLPVAAGQILTADVSTGEIHVARVQPAVAADAHAAPPLVVPPLVTPPPAVTPPAVTPPTASAPAPEPTEPDPASRWTALVNEGAYPEVLRAAEAMGIERCLARCSPAAKMSLADAARYRGQIDLARRALLALVDGDPQAGEVARSHYLLGQMAEREGAGAAALAEYRRCESADGRGTYASLALGRSIALLADLGDDGAARAAAQRYLERFPAGPHAERARAVVGRAP